MHPARRWWLRSRRVAGERAERWRERLRREAPVVELRQVQRRLELLLTALYGRVVAITEAAPPRRGWHRLVGREPAPDAAVPHTRGDTIHLPRSLAAHDGATAATARYRLLALEQGERLARGSAALAPADPLERDLYHLRESMAIDAAIARAHPALRETLAAARARALARRPRPGSLSPAEREVERLLRAALAADPAAADAPRGAPDDSLAWARDAVTAIRRHARVDEELARRGGIAYRGLPPVQHWGLAPAALDEAQRIPNPMAAAAQLHIIESENPDGEPDGVDDRKPGEGEGSIEREGDGQRTDGGGGTEDAAPDAEEGGAERAARDADVAPDGIVYPEWDGREGRYRPRGAVVRLVEAETPTDPEWAPRELRRHAALLRKVRRQFERFRAQRARLTRQRDGETLDLAACVRAMVDARMGRIPDDRLYATVRTTRSSLAILLLADVSGSTDTVVHGALQVIDLERTAMLLAMEALDALGDRYGVLAFSSRGASDVRLTTVKRFDEQGGEGARHRVGTLRPGGFTRMGAAIRHAASQLATQVVGHRLLLILSDGRPNDLDHYQDSYAVEDTRQAIIEARARGIFPFCLTIDREESEYLARIFGRAGYTILSDPEHLPTALLGVVRHLLA